MIAKHCPIACQASLLSQHYFYGQNPVSICVNRLVRHANVDFQKGWDQTSVHCMDRIECILVVRAIVALTAVKDEIHECDDVLVFRTGT